MQLNRSGAATHPCLTPLLIENQVVLAVDSHTTFCIAVELLKERDDLSRGSKDGKDLPERCVVNGVERRLEIEEGDVEVSISAELN